MKRAVFVVALILKCWLSGNCQACPGSALHAKNNHYGGCLNQAAGGWAPGAEVTVYLESIPTNYATAIEAAYNNWSSRLNSRVTIIPVNGPPVNPQYPYSVFLFGDTSACGSMKGACTSLNYSCVEGTTTYTETYLNATYIGVNNSGYQLFAHEIGHTYGIDDCLSNCPSVVTAMQPATTWNSPMAPHCCDTKLMYQMTGGFYGQQAPNCSPKLIQGVAANGSPTVTVTFPQNPQSGDTIVAGCVQAGYQSQLQLYDNQTVPGAQNSYYPPLDYAQLAPLQLGHSRTFTFRTPRLCPHNWVRSPLHAQVPEIFSPWNTPTLPARQTW